MRTLILGGTGTLGSALTAAADARGWPTLGTSFRGSADRTPLDVRDADAVSELFADFRPDATVCAAPLDADSAAHLANAVSAAGGVLAVFSCAAVYGECRVAAREEDELKPKGERGLEHAATEAAVRAALPERSLIVRTSGLFDGGRFGRVGRLVHKLRKGAGLTADNERVTQPTFAPDLAEVTLDLLKGGHCGAFNAAGPDRHTDFTFARLVAHLFGYDADLVQPAAGTDDRPAKVQLDRFRLRKLLGPDLFRPTADALRVVRAGMSEWSQIRVASAA